MTLDVVDKINQADMILIGLGEEFDQRKFLRSRGLERAKEILQDTGLLWLLPEVENALLTYEKNEEQKEILNRFTQLIEGKNYFIVSTSFSKAIRENGWKENRLVTPCYGYGRKQCGGLCGQMLQELTAQDRCTIKDMCEAVIKGEKVTAVNMLGCCESCHSPYVLNNIFAPEYNEDGYLPEWNLYKKWLQGTLNKKLLVLELGVGMQYPSVIRWPFEKTVFFNHKAELVRVHESLYQLSEDLKGKGVSISQNAIDWMRTLC